MHIHLYQYMYINTVQQDSSRVSTFLRPKGYDDGNAFHNMLFRLHRPLGWGPPPPGAPPAGEPPRDHPRNQH